MKPLKQEHPKFYFPCVHRDGFSVWYYRVMKVRKVDRFEVPKSMNKVKRQFSHQSMGTEAGKTVSARSSSRRRWRWWWLPLACFVSWVTTAAGGAVTSLPGFDGPLPFSLETGYVEVDESTSTRLFYYFVPSEKDPNQDPLMLWLMGGPGCSGLNGIVQEMGPFQFDTKWQYRGGLPRLIYRPETWTKVSNIIFVDSPVGTGFSYAATEEAFKSSDTKAGKQLLIFIRKWLHDHPQFLLNPLYIGGESYSGTIIPTLTLAISESNDSGEKPLLNLKGYIAGNPVTDTQFDENGRIPFFHGMGLIPDELYQHAKETCGGKYIAPTNARCAHSIQAINNCIKDINKAHILEPSCGVGSPRIRTTVVTDRMTTRTILQEFAAADDLTAFQCRIASYEVYNIWANNQTVRKSLGVHKGTVGEWKRCKFDIDYDKDVSTSTGTVEYHLRLMRKGYRVIIFSGDHDARVPFIGTHAWIRSLNLSIVDSWRPWYVAGQVAGFTISYASNNLTYATVKGAGHTPPEYKPKECQEMFRRWISGNPL